MQQTNTQSFWSAIVHICHLHKLIQNKTGKHGIHFIYGPILQAYSKGGKEYACWIRRDARALRWHRPNLKFQTSISCARCKANRHHVAKPWEGGWNNGYKKSRASSSYGNLKGSLQIKFRLCYSNLYLKVLLEIWALQLIWFSAPQKQANWSFSKTEFSLSKVSFLHFKSFFFETVLWNKMVLKTMFSLIVETLLRSWILSSCLTQKFSYLINVLSR